MAEKKEFYFQSSDGLHKVHGILWRPDDGHVKGVIQIVHGMAEYIGRYEEFAEFICARGYAVVGEEHLGHGASVNDPSEYGYFGKKNGMNFIIRDNAKLMRHMMKKYDGCPYFLLGHSMGSFITRMLITKYSGCLSGAIIMGTGGQTRLEAAAGKILTYITAAFKGWKFRSRLIHQIAFGAFNRKFEPARTKMDWLTKDTMIVDKYLEDEKCTFMFTVSGYRDLFGLILQISRREAVRKIRKDLPILIVSGADDPVGGFGKGVGRVCDQYRAEGLCNVQMKLYEHDRHEILNETDRKQVSEDLLNWIIQA